MHACRTPPKALAVHEWRACPRNPVNLQQHHFGSTFTLITLYQATRPDTEAFKETAGTNVYTHVHVHTSDLSHNIPITL
eukprot:366102-Chlamydomonas_euryale.AAC.3